MSARVYVDAVEGNDVWLVWRVTLPNGSTLVRSSFPLGDGLSDADPNAAGGAADAMEVSVIHESSLGNSKEVIQIYKGPVIPGYDGLVNGVADDNVDMNVWTTLQTSLWGGLDDTGYTIEARIRASSVNYVLEGGNTYAVEVNLKTSDWGTVSVSAQIQVDYLHSV